MSGIASVLRDVEFEPGYYSKRPEDPLGDQAVASMEQIFEILLKLISPNSDRLNTHYTYAQAISEISLACKPYLDAKLVQQDRIARK